MVVTAATESTRQARGSLRPVDPARDLGTIAELIATAFADEIDDRGRAALREMRWMARLSPLVWWWSQADPAFSDSFNGFVWEEPAPRGRGRRIVGNISLNRAPGDRHRRIICNVVVREAYRGQRIGRRLTEAAIGEAQILGAAGVVLQAYEDNPRALRLYTDLGFREAAGETDLHLGAVRPVQVVDAPGYRLSGWRPADGQAAYELARLATPVELQWIRPVRPDRYRLGSWTHAGQRLWGLITGQQTYRITARRAEWKDEDRLAALMTVTASFRGRYHHLELLADPDDAGPRDGTAAGGVLPGGVPSVEAALVSRALHILAAIPSRPVRATVYKTHTAALQALQGYGFEERRTLLTLRKDLA